MLQGLARDFGCVLSCEADAGVVAVLYVMVSAAGQEPPVSSLYMPACCSSDPQQIQL